MISPQMGEQTVVRSAVPGIVNRKLGIWLKEAGEDAAVVWSPFWQGELDRGRITLPFAQSPVIEDARAVAQVLPVAEEEPPKKKSRKSAATDDEIAEEPDDEE